MNLSLNRRSFLSGSGALVVAYAMDGPAAAQNLPGTPPKSRGVDARQVDSYFVIKADGGVMLYSGKVDLGTGHRIALPQIVADELGIPIERITMIEGDTHLTPDQGSTSGSNGIMRGGVQTRQAAATARAALIKLGAQKLGLPEAELDTAEGEVRPKKGGAGVTFAALLADSQFNLELDPKAPRRKPSEYKYVGKHVRRPDMQGKATGSHVWMHDFAVEGMLHGRSVYPPRPGAKLVSVDEASIADIPGVKVVRIKDYLGVVAAREWHAEKAARQLKAQWEGGGIVTTSAEAQTYLRSSGPRDKDEVTEKKGDFDKAWPETTKKLTADFYWPMQSHASLGPSCAIADVREGEATIWTASQGTHKFAEAFEGVLQLPKGKVRQIYLDGAGCYGMNGHDDAAIDAAILSRAVGKPVRVQWSRADELAWDPKGPPQTLTIEAGLDKEGRISAWRAHMWIPRLTPKLANVPLVSPQLAGLPQMQGIATGSINVGGIPTYDIPNMEAVLHYVKDTPARTSPLRAPGKLANLMAVETMMDELALAAGKDPLAFRLDYLKDPRSIDVLKKTAELHGWQGRVEPRRDGKGRGVAFTHYKGTETYVGMAMDVEVDRASGAIRVTRVSCAHDCGQVISPDSVKAQVEGCIIQGVSRAMFEETRFDRERITAVDWSSYQVITFPDVPALNISLIDRPDQPPVGAGEAAIAPVAAALANAVFDATGVRLRSAPFTPQRVRAAMVETGTKAG